jgi:hypothetical protein
MIKRCMLVPLFLSMFALAGCESGETVHQDTTVRTRSDGTKIKSEEKVVRQSDGTVVKTETKKVDHPDHDDDDVKIKID